MKTIGMVVALKNEVMPLLERMGVKLNTENRFGFDITEFKLSGKTIICVNSGIGEIHAAAATQTLIGVYGAEAVINFGVCGTLADVALLDTVIVKGVVHYDFDLSPIDPVKKGQYPGEEAEVIETDGKLRKIAKKFSKNAKEVICASADKFVADEEIKAELHEKYGADVCEMESAGVLITCKHAGVPCLIIKAVSDGKGGAEEFKEMVDEASKSYVDLVVKLVAEL